MESREEARQELAMIRELMDEGRRVVCGGSRHYVVWALLITGALVATYLAESGRLPMEEGWIWLAAVGLGWLLSLRIGRREEKRSPVRGPAGLLLMKVWIGAGIGMTLLGFVGSGTGTLTGSGLLGAMACIIGAAMFASGTAYRGSWPQWLAVGWWAGAVAILLWPGPHALLLMAGLLVGLQLVPGLVLLREEARPGGRQRPAGGIRSPKSGPSASGAGDATVSSRSVEKAP